MILPADYKPPIDETEEDFDGSYETTYDPSDSEPSDYIPYSPSSSSSGSAYSTPFEGDALLSSSPDDLEWGPVPPYTPRPPISGESEQMAITAQASVILTKRERRRRWVRLAGMATIGYLAVLGGLSLLFGMRLRGRGGGWRMSHGRPGPGDMGFEREGIRGPGEVGPMGGEEYRRLGELDRECVTFTAGDDWKSSPTDDSGARQWTNNQTFLLPTQKDIFAQLTGAYPYGQVLVHTFDADGREDSKTISGVKKVKEGEYVKVVVQSMISSVADDPTEAEVDETEGWKILTASDVCLVDYHPGLHRPHNPRGHDERHHLPPLPPPPHAMPIPQVPLALTRPGPQDPAVGVTIRTRRPDTVPEPQPHPHDPALSFLIHVYIPRVPAEKASASSSLASLLGLRTRRSMSPPKQHVRSLDISTGVGEIAIDIPHTAVGDLSMRSAVGTVKFEEVRVERLQATVNGDVVGQVAISEAIDVSTTVGNVDLDLTLANRQSFAPSHAHAHGPAHPILVNVQTNTGTSSIRYAAWEDPHRPVRTEVQATVGDVHVESHPAFQGAFVLSTTLGMVESEERDVQDPEGKGRKRTIKTNKKGGMGATVWEGSVRWVGADAGDEPTEAEGTVAGKHITERRWMDRRVREEGWLRAKTTTGNVKVVW